MKRWRLGIAMQVCQTPGFGFELSALFLFPGFYKSCLAMSKGTHIPCVAEPGFHRNIQKLRKTCEEIHTIFVTMHLTFVPNSYQIIPNSTIDVHLSSPKNQKQLMIFSVAPSVDFDLPSFQRCSKLHRLPGTKCCSLPQSETMMETW